MSIVTQPYRRPSDARLDHYLTTLTSPYDLAGRVDEVGASDLVNLTAFLRAHPTGEARIWALRDNRVGRSVWPAMRRNDLVLFYGNGQVYAQARVTAKVYWPSNAYIWPEGVDWDYLYSLRDFSLIPEADRPRTSDLRAALANFSVQPAQLHDLAALVTSEAEVADALGLTFVAQGAPLPEAQVAAQALPSVQAPALPAEGPLGRPATGQTFSGLTIPQNPVTPGWQAIERGTLAHQQVLLQLQQLVEMRCGADLRHERLQFRLVLVGRRTYLHLRDQEPDGTERVRPDTAWARSSSRLPLGRHPSPP